MRISQISCFVILFFFIFHVISNLNPNFNFTGFAALKNPERGDCNKDGKLSWEDVKCYEGALTYGYQYEYLDLNEDNEVNKEDLLLLEDKLIR